MAWLARHPRFVFHFTPTSASWLNAVEGFFANLLGAGSNAACSGPSSICAAINRFVEEANHHRRLSQAQDAVACWIRCLHCSQPLMRIAVRR